MSKSSGIPLFISTPCRSAIGRATFSVLQSEVWRLAAQEEDKADMGHVVEAATIPPVSPNMQGHEPIQESLQDHALAPLPYASQSRSARPACNGSRIARKMSDVSPGDQIVSCLKLMHSTKMAISASPTL